jgi:hypothetical protein
MGAVRSSLGRAVAAVAALLARLRFQLLGPRRRLQSGRRPAAVAAPEAAPVADDAAPGGQGEARRGAGMRGGRNHSALSCSFSYWSLRISTEWQRKKVQNDLTTLI